MIKLLDILENKILVPRRSREERAKNYQIVLQKKIQQYIKDGGEGDLNLDNTKITSLPSGLTVGGYLNLYRTPIKSLPPGLTVRGYLDLRYCKNLTLLPSGLSVGGSLSLFNTKITSLPPGLTVGGYLNLNETSIKSLPSDLNVGGDLHLSGTPLSESHTEEQIKQMAPGIKGDIYI